MEDIINDELNEELEEEPEDVDLDEGSDTNVDDDVEFDYDDEGNIVIPDDSDSINGEEAEADNEETDSTAVNDSTTDAPAPTSTEEANIPSTPDERDTRIAELTKMLEERDSQIRDTLRSLGADENEGIAGLERLAAEAAEMSVEEYRKKKAERLQYEEAMRVVQKQRFEEKIRADLAAVNSAYPETKLYKSVYEFPNFEKFSKYRDLGLSPAEAYIAANPTGVITSAAAAAQQRARNLNSTKRHLQSNVPVGSRDNSIKITRSQMAEYKDLFPDLSDKEIVALYKQTMKK